MKHYLTAILLLFSCFSFAQQLTETNTGVQITWSQDFEKYAVTITDDNKFRCLYTTEKSLNVNFLSGQYDIQLIGITGQDKQILQTWTVDYTRPMKVRSMQGEVIGYYKKFKDIPMPSNGWVIIDNTIHLILNQ